MPLLVAQGDERAGPLLDELRGLLDGFPVETQFHNPFRAAVAEHALWRGDPEAALKSIMDGIRETEDREWPRYQLRLFRVGMRAAADIAEVARARRDAAGEAAAIASGDALWAALQPILDAAGDRPHGLDSEENEAEIATVEAERARLLHTPAAALWADAAERWRAPENPYLMAYCGWRQAEALLGDGDRASAAVALVGAHRIATELGARPLIAAIEALAARSRLDVSTNGAAAVVAAGVRRPWRIRSG